jgi:hypothetical protein
MSSGPRPSDNPNYAYEPAPYPILEDWPEFANFVGSGLIARDAEISNIIEARALAYGGEGYRYHGGERER